MISVTHTHADGTLVDGTSKGDGTAAILKTHGFRWFPSLKMWGVPSSRDKSAKTWIINGAVEVLRAAGYEVSVDINEDERRSFAEAEAERAERAEARMERFAGYADNAAQSADAAHARAQQMGDAIPFGQPIIGRRDAAYRERMRAAYDRSLRESDRARHHEHRAEAAEANQAHRENIPATLRRIAKLEAEQRQIRRRLDGSGLEMHGEDTPATGAYRDRLTHRMTDLIEELAYWREHVAQAEAQGAKVWSREDFTKGDFVESVGRWYEVLRVSAKSLTVPDPMPLIGTTTVFSRETAQAESGKRGFRRMYTSTVPYDKVSARKSADEMAQIMAAAG